MKPRARTGTDKRVRFHATRMRTDKARTRTKSRAARVVRPRKASKVLMVAWVRMCACARVCACVRSRARTRGRPSCATGRPPPPRAAAAPPPAPPGGPAPARRSEPSGGAASTQTRPSQNYNDNKSGKPRPSNCVRLTGDARAVQPRRIRRNRVDANKAIAPLCGTQSGKPSRWPGAFALSTVAFSMIWVISRAL